MPRLVHGCRMYRWSSCLLSLALLTACAPGRPSAAPRLVHSETYVSLHGHALTVHLSVPAGVHAGPLLVYATGDGGWWGKDKAIFTRLAGWGYSVAGFSARDYVHHLGSEAVRPVTIAADYNAIIDAAEKALGLPPSTRIILVGKSRGSGLEVAAASRALLRPQIAGIVAIALTKEEEYVHRRLRRTRQFAMLQTYDALPLIGPVPVAVIQSTNDNYLPATKARELFGADSPTRRFLAVEASDHNFDGAQDVMYQDIRESLEWIVDR